MELFCFSWSCVPYVVSFSGLSIYDFPSGVLWHLFTLFDVEYCTEKIVIKNFEQW
jgi:hypothetical protein